MAGLPMMITTAASATNSRRRSAATAMALSALHALLLLLHPTTTAATSSDTRIRRLPSKESSSRELQQQAPLARRMQTTDDDGATMEGSCLGSRLEAGQQRGKNSFLCDSADSPVHKFGIDTSDRLSYYINDKRIWSATPPAADDTPDCVVFGRCSPPPLQFFRLRASGDLVGFTPDRKRVWESHSEEGLGEGEYSGYALEELGMEGASNKVGEMRAGSVLEVTEDGVFIYDEDGGGVVTWRIAAPEEVTVEETGSPTKGPTRNPTSQPTNQPTAATQNTGSIEGFVWDDTPTNDAVYNSGDVPLEGVAVVVHICDGMMVGAVAASLTTGEDGTFSVDGLQAGRYFVKVSPPEEEENGGGASMFANNDENSNSEWGFVQQDANANGMGGANGNAIAEDSDVDAAGQSDCMEVGGDGMAHYVYVGMIQTTDDIEGGDEEEVTVSGTIFHDADGDGLMDADPVVDDDALGVIGQVVVDLYDCATEEWVLITRTDSDGKYEFTIPLAGGGTTADLSSRLEGLGVATIRAEFTLPAAAAGTYEFVSPSRDSDVDPSTGRTACWDLDVDGLGSIVWNAGMQAAGGASVPAATTTTMATKAPTSKPTVKPTPAPSPATAPNEAPTGGIVGGYAFLDANDDGIRALGVEAEPAMADVEVRLFSCVPPTSGAQGFAGSGSGRQSGGETLLGVQRTNGQGFYSFRNLFSGYYTVKVVPPPGHAISSAWSTTGDDASSDIDNAVNPNTRGTECFQLVGGDTDLRWDVGLVPTDDGGDGGEDATPLEPTATPVEQTPATIAGFVFHDVNNNGFLEDGEPALPNAQAALFDCGGNIVKVATTDDNGMYGFEGVTPGGYEVRFSLEGYRAGDVWTGLIDEEGKLAAPDAQNDANPETGGTECKVFGPGETVFDLDAGMIPIPGGETASPIAAGATPPASTPTMRPTTKATADPKGDGTKCSGAKCPIEGMCRNKAGLCGAGIGFCNPSSVWDASCPEKEEVAPRPPPTVAPSPAPTNSLAPSGSTRPSTAPTISSIPTQSTSPTRGKSVDEPTDVAIEPVGSVCNEDGSYGTTGLVGASEAQPLEVAFTYALRSADGTSPGPNLVASFEEQLNQRLACIYFEDACLACDDGSRKLRGQRRAQEDGSTMGLSSLPKDVLNLFEVCSGSTTDCRVIDGKFTAYYPMDMTPEELDEESERMLDAVIQELGKDDWQGLQVSYDNAPFPPASVDKGGGGDEGGGVSGGAIAGIVIAVLVLLAVVAGGTIFFIRHKRNKEDEYFERPQQRAVPFGDSLGSKGDDFDESDSDDSSSSGSSSSGESSSSEETDVLSGSFGTPTATSGDTFPTQAAQARSVDIDDDEESEGSYSESGDEESFGEGFDNRNVGNARRLQQSAASDEAAVYEGDDTAANGYDGEEFAGDDYAAEDNQGYDSGNYNAQEGGNDYDAGQEGSQEGEYMHQDFGGGGHMKDMDDAGSMNSADPPGTSYRDLPHEDEQWDPSMAPVPEQQPFQRMNQGGFDGEQFDESPHESFRVYESDNGTADDSYHSYGHPADDAQNSYHSNQDEGHGIDGSHTSVHSYRSSHSQGSQRSFHSNQSFHSQGGRSNHSRHSQEDGMHEQDDYGEGQYSQEYQQQQQQDYDNYKQQQSFHSVHSHQSGRSNHSRRSREDEAQQQSYDGAHYSQEYREHQNYDEGQIYQQQQGYDEGQPQYSQEYQQQQQNYDEAQYSQEYMDGGDQQNPPQPAYDAEYDYQYPMDGGSNGHDHIARDGQFSGSGQYGTSMDENRMAYDESSYHSFSDIPASNTPTRPEELDEVSHAGSAYTAATRQVSNTSSPAVAPKPSVRQEVFGEEEESISNIFNSLSEIQKRLASKGAQSDDAYEQSYQPAVEDASMDGSQYSNNLASSAVRNRRPQQDQWMEPVDEH